MRRGQSVNNFISPNFFFISIMPFGTKDIAESSEVLTRTMEKLVKNTEALAKVTDTLSTSTQPLGSDMKTLATEIHDLKAEMADMNKSITTLAQSFETQMKLLNQNLLLFAKTITPKGMVDNVKDSLNIRKMLPKFLKKDDSLETLRDE